MTVLSSETRLIGSGTGLLPRVNLLPPEIAEKRQFRRIQTALGSAVLASVAVVGLLYVSAGHSVSSAQSDLDSANAQGSALQLEAAKYRNVTAVYAAADAAQQQLSVAMGDEVRYSQLLNDLSLTVPSNVWISNLAYTAGADGAAAPTAATTAGAAGAPAAPAALGTFTVTGIGFEHDDVAQWLDAIAGLKTYDTPYFSTSTESLLGTRKIVTFTSTANVTDKARSNRYNKVGG